MRDDVRERCAKLLETARERRRRARDLWVAGRTSEALAAQREVLAAQRELNTLLARTVETNRDILGGTPVPWRDMLAFLDDDRDDGRLPS